MLIPAAMILGAIPMMITEFFIIIIMTILWIRSFLGRKNANNGKRRILGDNYVLFR